MLQELELFYKEKQINELNKQIEVELNWVRTLY